MGTIVVDEDMMQMWKDYGKQSRKRDLLDTAEWFGEKLVASLIFVYIDRVY